MNDAAAESALDCRFPARAGHRPRSTDKKNPAAEAGKHLRQFLKRTASEVDGRGHLEAEWDHKGEYSGFSGVQPLLHESQGNDQRAADGERQNEQDPADEKGAVLARIAVDQEPCEPHPRHQLQ